MNSGICCEAPVSYEGGCDHELNTIGMSEKDKHEMATSCDVRSSREIYTACIRQNRFAVGRASRRRKKTMGKYALMVGHCSLGNLAQHRVTTSDRVMHSLDWVV
eukprot:TRINITY_DN651_c0_g1_i8.p2 TRINITY_DN651_c0_g1~~TRINITY_DN651_c0_g1_i8.p2  ORF type:complete len:104 (+),score=7.21 TRINITY_DN651_c0_g1_i8:138-449(+)